MAFVAFLAVGASLAFVVPPVAVTTPTPVIHSVPVVRAEPSAVAAGVVGRAFAQKVALAAAGAITTAVVLPVTNAVQRHARKYREDM